MYHCIVSIYRRHTVIVEVNSHKTFAYCDYILQTMVVFLFTFFKCKIIIYNGIPAVTFGGVDVCNASSSILMFVVIVVVVGEINDQPTYCRVRCLCAVVCAYLYIYLILLYTSIYSILYVHVLRVRTCIVCRCNALNSVKIYIHIGPFLLVFSFGLLFFLYYISI